MAAPLAQPTTNPSRPSIIYILGAPGAGKETLCKLLAKAYTNVYHLSVGDHLRHLQSQDSSQSTSDSFGGLDHETFTERMQQRQLLPTDTIVAIVDAALKAVSDTASFSEISNPIVLVDGFPRSIRSVQLADVRWGLPDGVFFFDCPRQLAEARFLERKRSADDSVEIFRTRYDEFDRLDGEIVTMYSHIVVRISTETGTEETWKAFRNSVKEVMVRLGATKSDTLDEMDID